MAWHGMVMMVFLALMLTLLLMRPPFHGWFERRGRTGGHMSIVGPCRGGFLGLSVKGRRSLSDRLEATMGKERGDSE